MMFFAYLATLCIPRLYMYLLKRHGLSWYGNSMITCDFSTILYVSFGYVFRDNFLCAARFRLMLNKTALTSLFVGKPSRQPEALPFIFVYRDTAVFK